MIELRSYVLYCDKGGTASVEAYLAHWLESVAPGFEGSGVSVTYLLSAEAWIPFILVDGWDELGDIGTTFREKLLGLIQEFSRINVLVTSRPYGSSPPSSSDGFDQLHVQPLNQNEIRTFAQQFYRNGYEEEETVVLERTKQFEVALTRSADGQLMAKTPLLLTMMLFINRSKRLPDKRHELYRECLLSYLSDRPELQKNEGARLPIGQWHPPQKGTDLLDLVARIAHDIQSKHTTSDGTEAGTTSIILPKEDWLVYLPARWEPREKDGFMLWLCNRAGILTDNTDDHFWFTHRTFQEFLTAWYLYRKTAPKKTKDVFQKRVKEIGWWETLLLWGALLQDTNKEQVTLLIESMLTSSPIFASLLLADGLGSNDQISKSAELISRLFHKGPLPQAEFWTRAWQTSRQNKRQNLLFQSLRQSAGDAGWMICLRIMNAMRKIGYEGEVPIKFPESPRQAAVAILAQSQNLRPKFISAQQFAGARTLIGLTETWMGSPCSLFQLWPSNRSNLSLIIQRGVSLDMTYPELVNAIPEWLKNIRYGWWKLDMLQAFGLARRNNRRGSLEQIRKLELFREMALALALNSNTTSLNIAPHVRHIDAYAHVHRLRNELILTSNSWEPFTAWLLFLVEQRLEASGTDLSRTGPHPLPMDSAQDNSKYLDNRVYNNNKTSYENRTELTSGLNLHLMFGSVFRSFMSVLRDSSLDIVTQPEDRPIWRLMGAAARSSISCAASDKEKLEYLLNDPDYASIDDFWCSFARHVGRISTDADRQRLHELASYPEKQDGEVSWGLQFMVRGDILLADGTIVTLDSICADAGIEPLPMLEELLPERLPFS